MCTHAYLDVDAGAAPRAACRPGHLFCWLGSGFGLCLSDGKLALTWSGFPLNFPEAKVCRAGFLKNSLVFNDHQSKLVAPLVPWGSRCPPCMVWTPEPALEPRQLWPFIPFCSFPVFYFSVQSYMVRDAVKF